MLNAAAQGRLVCCLSCPSHPFNYPLPVAARLTVAIGMSLARVVRAALAGRSLTLSWPLAALTGGAASALLGALAWRSPEAFFKDRS